MKTLVCILVLTVTLGAQSAAQKTGANQITEIRFENDGGFGVDRGFVVCFEKNGAATFRGGKNYYVRKGKYVGAITTKQFQSLAKTIVARNFFRLENRYEGTTMDVGTRTITVVYNDREKSVVNWGGYEQKDFARIERAVRRLEAQIRWRSPDDLK